MINHETLDSSQSIPPLTRDPYAVAQASAALLNADPNNGGTIAQYVRALMALGLGTLAKRLWEKVSTEPSAPTVSGVIAWASRKRRFAANVAILQKRWPQVADHLQVWEQTAARFEMHQATDGNYHLLDLSQPQFWNGWLNGLTDHKKEAALFTFNKAATPLPGPIVFDGVGFGWLLQKVLSETEHSYLNYSCAVYVIEPDPTALAMLLHMHDMQQWLNHPRVHLFTGPAAADDFMVALRANRQWTVPHQYIENRLTARPGIGIDKICHQMGRERREQNEAAQNRVHQLYVACDVPYWRQRFADALAGKYPLRVLGITTRYSTVLQYTLAELGRAIQAAGHEFKISMEADDHSLERPDLDLIADFKPDLLVQISRMRYEIPWLPREIPYLCWDQDNLPCMRRPEATASLDSLTYVAGHGAIHGFLDLGWPKRNSIFCYAAAANHTYSAQPLPAEKLAPYTCDFSYVSNAWQPASAMRDDLLAQWSSNKGLAELFGRISEEILTTANAGARWDSQQIRSLVQQHGRQVGLRDHEPVIVELAMHGTRLADRAYRHVGLRWVADWCRQNNKTLRLYGSGWESNPEFALFAAGPAKPGEELRAIYQATRINLQIIETGFLHSRALDGIAAGGFFMCREEPDELIYNGIPHAQYHRAMLELSQIALARGYEGIPDLEQAGDADLLTRWAKLKTWLVEAHGQRRLDKVLQTAAVFLRPRDLLPELPQISFNDPLRFMELATRFLNDDALRQHIATAMRQRVLASLSYDARWKTFVESIAAGLAATDTPASTPDLVAV